MRKFPTSGTREAFAASDISSVIARAKPENGSEQTKADERIRKHQNAGPERLIRKTACLWGFLQAAAETPCLPANSLRSRRNERTPIFSDTSTAATRSDPSLSRAVSSVPASRQAAR